MSQSAADRAVQEAKQLFDRGSYAGAYSIIEKTLGAAPNHVGALGLLASLKLQQRDLEGALRVLRLAESAAPFDASIKFASANILLELGRTEEATAAFRGCANSRGAKPIALHLDLAQTFQQLGLLNDALGNYEEILRLEPGLAAALVGKGTCLAGLKHNVEAIEMFDAALLISPNEPDIYFNKALSLSVLGRHAEALVAIDACLRLAPNDDEARIQRGVALVELNRSEEALALLQDVCRRRPTAEAFANAGLALLNLGLGDQAYAAFDQGVALGRNLWPQRQASLRYHRGVAALSLNQVSRGWPDYEARWAAGLVDPPALDRGEPRWRGERVAGRLRVWREQPIGDELLFARFVPIAKNSAGRLTLECSPRFVPLFARSFPDVDVRAQGDAREPSDAQISLASLGAILMPTSTSVVDGAPYLKSDAHLTSVFRRRYEALAQGRLIVGISWYSNNKRIGSEKSAPLTEWAALLRRDHFFVNLQYGKAAAEAISANESFGCAIHTDDEVDQLVSLEAFAAQVGAMDCVLSVSNTTVHFAGALGVPCVVMLPAERGKLWYWGLNGDATPWYSSVRISRTNKQSTWARHVEEAADKVEGLARQVLNRSRS